MDSRSTSISVIIPCFNEEQLLATCLDSIIQQEHDLGADGEIIIALNGCTDNSARIASAYAKNNVRITVIDLPVPHKKQAMNAALDIARNARIIFNDADSFLDFDALKEANTYFALEKYAIFGAIRRPHLDTSKVNKSFIETYYMMHYAKRLSLKDRLSIQGWFMAIDLSLLGDFRFPLDASADDIWLSAYTWTRHGASAIGYIPRAIGTYVPPSTIEDMQKQIARHRSNHKVVKMLHEDLSEYFAVRKAYYNDIHVGPQWRERSIALSIDFDTWIAPYETFVSSVEASIKNIDYTNVSWERITSSKSLPVT